MTGSMSGQDLALILGTIIGGLGALAAFVTAMFRIARGVAEINRAVNHQSPDEPRLVERAKNLEAAQREHNERQRLMEMLATRRHDENTAALAALGKDMRSLGARVARLESVHKTPRKGMS